MRAVVFTEPGHWELVTRPTPTPGPGQVLLRVEAAGVCGTDLHIFHGRFPARFPLVPGHEFAGVAEEVGEGVTSIRPGELASVDPILPDYTCEQCRRGRLHLCQHLQAFGVHLDGGFATHCLVPATHAFVVPPQLTAEQAALLEPIGCCLHGLDRITLRQGDRVVVIGAGWIGQIMLQLVRLQGASLLIVSEPKQAKREQALHLGADQAVDPTREDLAALVREATGGLGADVVIEAVGSAATAAAALELAAPGGSVLLFGVAPPEARIQASPYAIYRQELTVAGSFSLVANQQAAARLLASRRLHIEPLISAHYPLAELAAALEALERGEALKSVLLPWR